MKEGVKEIISPIEKFVKRELKDNCVLWDAEPEKFSEKTFSQIENKLGILQLSELFPEDFPAIASEIIRLLSYGCGAIGFLYSIHFSIVSFLKSVGEKTPSELTISPVILDENDWLFYFEKEGKFSGRLNGVMGGNLGKIFFLPVTKSDETKGWILVRGKFSYTEEVKFLPGLRALPTGSADFENFHGKGELAYLPEGDWFEEFKSWFLYYNLPLINGLVEGAYEIAKEYALERKQGGKLIIEIPSVLRLLSQIESALDLIDAARKEFKPEGKNWIKNIRNIYLGIINQAEEAILNSIQVMGGYGYMQDYKVERILRDFRSIRSIFSPLEYI